MASSRAETPINWSAAPTVTLSAATASTSDLFTFNVEDWEAELVVYIDNQGTPATGDVVNIKIAYSVGTVDGAAGDDYVTTKAAEFLGRLNTVAAEADGEDPQIKCFPIRTGAKAFKLVVDAPQAATRNIIVRATVGVHRPQ